jgi:hypothetical protein
VGVSSLFPTKASLSVLFIFSTELVKGGTKSNIDREERGEEERRGEEGEEGEESRGEERRGAKRRGKEE